MIAICSHTEESKREYQKKYDELQVIWKERGYKNYNDACVAITKKSGYAKCTYTGTLKDDLDCLSALQVAMLCDGGFSWFGGGCSKDGLKFTVVIYTD